MLADIVVHPGDQQFARLSPSPLSAAKEPAVEPSSGALRK
jgi:hypothetical protein